MRKWIGLMTGALCVLSSPLTADEAPLAETPEVVPAESTAVPEVLTTAPAEVLADDEQTPKQVGKASADSTNTAKSSNIAKYTLAAAAVVIGVTAIILVSRHHGHHHHHSK